MSACTPSWFSTSPSCELCPISAEQTSRDEGVRGRCSTRLNCQWKMSAALTPAESQVALGRLDERNRVSAENLESQLLSAQEFMPPIRKERPSDSQEGDSSGSGARRCFDNRTYFIACPGECRRRQRVINGKCWTLFTAGELNRSLSQRSE